ncbi:unnamed protein product [Dovyalis caffra]|uniref:Uncharacterized protein n=1 Tax=Dovyalis caffra TaxID=77055 RepID=A0AAV1S8H8_9ROSI|nr:unnamed protein product [Dovyalis caffra]
MIEKSKKSKREYTATTVLALLQEVAQFDGVKIDWNALVEKTTTGIFNAREYQMIWRHLAYRHVLPEKIDDGAHPLDDDSDLESELEAFPSVTSEASSEAAACVKVLIASGLPSHSNSTTVEAPLTINIPNGQPFRATSENSQPAVMQGMNITVPVSVQKLSLPGGTSVTSAEVFDANGSGSGTFPPRRKRKPWSEAEDMELISAVDKFGEGNWANIVRGEFKGDRTASQLSQRWSIIRKRQRNSNSGNVTSGPQLSEVQRAACHAVKMALDSHPAAKSSIASCSGGTTSNKTSTNCMPPAIITETPPVQHLSQQRPTVTKSSTIWPLGSAAKSQAMLTKTSTKSILSSDPVRAAAVAAGARIATQSDAASLLKAAQAKNAVHIMPTGNSSIKSSMAGGVSIHSETNPNTQFISSGMATTPTTTRSAVSSPCPGLAKATSLPPQVKASSLTTQHTKSTSITSLSTISEQTNPGLAKATSLPSQVKASSPTTQHAQPTPVTSDMLSERTDTEILPKQGILTVEDIVGSQDVANDQVQKDGAHVSVKEPSEQVQEVKAALTNQEAELKGQVAVVESSNASPKLAMNESDLRNVTGNHVEGSQSTDDNKMTCTPIKEAENQSAVQENGKSTSAGEKQADLPSTVTYNSCKNVENLVESNDLVRLCNAVNSSCSLGLIDPVAMDAFERPCPCLKKSDRHG